jgi:hypothetical protein
MTGFWGRRPMFCSHWEWFKRRLSAWRNKQDFYIECMCCGRSCEMTINHTTYLGLGRAMSPMCKECWLDAGVAPERSVYYKRLIQIWRDQGAAGDYPPCDDHLAEILNAEQYGLSDSRADEIARKYRREAA